MEQLGVKLQALPAIEVRKGESGNPPAKTNLQSTLSHCRAAIFCRIF